MFGKKDDKNLNQPIGFTKQKRFLFFKIKSKPIYQPQAQQQQQGKISKFQLYIASVAAKHKGLDIALREQGIKESVYDFVKKMLINSIIVSVVLAIAVMMLLLRYNLSMPISIVFAVLLGYSFYVVFFNKFIQYPIDKSKNEGKEIERDILFAARDLVIGMRSGMPLFNALTTVSTGYGAASKEFAKIVELVQLGMPIEQAIDEVSSKSQSKTFKSLMLQASVSIKAGADIVGALQGVVDEVMQERTIELRRYGQRLNALAMFYMLFGIIFPSMGIAVAAILTTFISLFTVNESTLIFALVGIFFLQLIFLNIMRSSRPTFAM
ncbi:MAG: type II secretion system F family protein [Candidatus Micrarchaeia archaeon]